MQPAFLVTFRTAPTEPAETVQKFGFNDAWAFADNRARHNPLFRLVMIAEKASGFVVYRG